MRYPEAPEPVEKSFEFSVYLDCVIGIRFQTLDRNRAVFPVAHDRVGLRRVGTFSLAIFHLVQRRLFRAAAQITSPMDSDGRRRQRECLQKLNGSGRCEAERLPVSTESSAEL